MCRLSNKSTINRHKGDLTVQLQVLYRLSNLQVPVKYNHRPPTTDQQPPTRDIFS